MTIDRDKSRYADLVVAAEFALHELECVEDRCSCEDGYTCTLHTTLHKLREALGLPHESETTSA